MEVVDVDPFAVLKVTATPAGSAFTRAVQFSRDRDERQEQLRSLTTTLASGEPTIVALLDAIGTEPARLPRAAAALHHVAGLAIVTGSRPVRTTLGKVTGQNCMSSPPVPPLVQGGPRGG